MNMTPDTMIHIFSFFFGACIGSFLNVCIYRIPKSESITHPGSRCPKCLEPVRFYDNIPIISYLILLGRCRNCKVRIPLRYPSVELLGGMASLCLVLKFGLHLETAVLFVFIATLLVATFIDVDHQIIPDTITLPGIVVFFLASFVMPDISWAQSLIGIITGGGSLLAVAWIYSLLTGKEGMGGGDIKLLAMIGALTGWKGVLFTIMASSAIGTLAGISVMIKTGKNMKLAVPFGPFLSIGAILYIFFGPQIIYWYFNLL